MSKDCGISDTTSSRHVHPHRMGKATACLALAVSLTFAVSAVHAATVRAVQGQVLVNSGQGYRLVDGATSLGVGGTVVANPGAIAHVIYPNGCRVTVQPGSIYQVASDPPCDTGAPTKTGGLDGTAPSSGINPWFIGGAGLVIAGGIAYGISSASP